jgi:hypothetical protein
VASTAVFRLDDATNFYHLKKLAFDYWLLDYYLAKEGLSDDDLLKGLELTDENHSHIPITMNIFEFYTFRGNTNYSQITLILKQKLTDLDHISLL